MAITRTAKGTTGAKAGVPIGALTVAAVTIAAGSTIIVGTCATGGSTEADSVKWGATALTLKETLGKTCLYVLENCAGGTEDVVADFTLGLATAATMFVSEISGAAAASYDVDISASGSSTTPSSGATAATAQADELLIGVVGTNGPGGDTAGTWSNSFNAGQRNGTAGGVATTNVTVSEGYLVVAATGTYTAAKTGITSRAWDAICATFKAASGQDLSTKRVVHEAITMISGG